MKRRTFLRNTLLGGAMCAAGGPLYAKPKQPKQPNIVLLLTDDQSYRTLGCYGNTQAKSPNLDKLAKAGIAFDSAYDTTAICMASRAQVMTGMYEYKTGCNFSHGPLLRDKWNQYAYPVLLRNAGYHTGFVGKFGFAVADPGGNSNYHTYDALPMDSFDEWYGWTGQGEYKTANNKYVAQYAEKYPHVTRACGAVSQDFIKSAAKENKPFCLSVSFKATHGPMRPDPYFDDVYADTVWAEPANYGEVGAAHLPQQAKSGRQYLSKRDFRPEKYQETMRKYYQLAYGIDYAVGMIREELERQGVADNTVILYLTDNGYSCGAHAMGGKVLPYEEASRSPMIAYDPRRSGGKRVKSVTGNIDMAPTILDLAGLPIPEIMDGKSLVPLLENPAGRVRESMLLINAWGPTPTHSLAVVGEDYKYIHWPFAQEMEPAEELYHLTSDRYEMRNLANNPKNRAILKRMQTRYDAHLATWKAEGVQESGYPLHATVYDRHLSWEEKLAAMDKKTRRKYFEWNDAKTKRKK